MSKPRLKVISLTHGGILNATGRQRYAPLFENPDIDLTLVVPHVWTEFDKTISPDPVDPGTKVRIEKIRFHSLPKVKWYLHHYPTLGKIIKEIQPDVIHLWQEPWAIVSLQAAYLRNRYAPNAALVLETDQNILRKLPTPFEQIRRYLLKQTDLLIGRGDEALDVSRACGYTGPTEIVEYGIERANFTPGGRDEARKEFGVRSFTIGYVGRIVSYKGLNDVLHAMHLSGNDIQFNVLGAGPDKEDFLAYAASLGLSHRVSVFKPRPASEVARFIKSLDALVLMSKTTKTWKEQFGRVIMEAQACGVPVIGSDSGSIPSVIGDGGWVVHEGDSEKLAVLLDHLIDNPLEVKEKGSEGLHQADTRFSFNVIADALMQAYTSAARHRKQIRSIGKATSLILNEKISE